MYLFRLVAWVLFLTYMCTGVELLCHMAALFLVFKEPPTALQSGCTSLHSHQQCRCAPSSRRRFMILRQEPASVHDNQRPTMSELPRGAKIQACFCARRWVQRLEGPYGIAHSLMPLPPTWKTASQKTALPRGRPAMAFVHSRQDFDDMLIWCYCSFYHHHHLFFPYSYHDCQGLSISWRGQEKHSFCDNVQNF